MKPWITKRVWIPPARSPSGVRFGYWEIRKAEADMSDGKPEEKRKNTGRHDPDEHRPNNMPIT